MDSGTGRRDALAPLRERRFRWYFGSRMVDFLGTTMGSLALAFAVLEVDDSPQALGLVLAAHSIPLVLFLLLGGVIADRFGRTRVIQVSNLAAGVSQLLIAGLILSGTATLWQLVVLTAVNGVASAASMPALASMLPQLVPRSQLQSANVLTAMSRNIVLVLGPALSGALVAGVGAGWALAVDGVTFLVAAAMLLPVKVPAAAPDSGSGSVVTDLREGWTYVRSTTWLWLVVLAFSVLNALQVGALNTLGPALALETPIGEAGWGLIVSAQAVGFVVTTVVFLRLRLDRPLLWGMLGCALFALPLLVLGLHPLTVPVMLAAFVAGVGIEVFGLGWNLAMQEHVPEAMLSRAYSYDMLGSFVAIPVGQLAFGPLGAVFGKQDTILAAGVLYAVVALATLASRSVRRLERLPEPDDAAAGVVTSTTSPPPS